MDSLGKILKDIRAKHTMTQSLAAQKIGIEQSYLSKLESDQAWASLDILTRVCKVYKTDVKTLLGQVDQDSLRGNLQYQGFLLRRAEQGRRTWNFAGVLLSITCAFAISIILNREPSSVVELVHTPLSMEIVDLGGKETLQLVADYGGLIIKGIEDVDGQIEHLLLKNKPWDIALAEVANELGYRVEIRGAYVELIPVTKLIKAG